MRYGQTKQIQDGATIDSLCNQINGAKYQFGFQKTNYRRVGWIYSVRALSVFGEELFSFYTKGDNIAVGECEYKAGITPVSWELLNQIWEQE